jgi:hypothetical protein
MAFGGNNPGLWGESVRKALNSSEERDARDHETGAEQVQLDKAELRELERSELYGVAPQARETPQARQLSRLGGIFAQIFRRSA